MRQHFLLSTKARTLSLLEVARLSDSEAEDVFRAVRFADNGGEPFCPRCGATGIYEYESRSIFKCRDCQHQFSLTSGTIFAGRKLPLRDILAAIAIFANGANGVSALRLSRELGRHYRTAYLLQHKLREVMGSLRSPEKLTGTVEIDGAYFGGHIKPKNVKKAREDRRKKDKAKRMSIVTMRERRRGGRTVSVVCKSENEALKDILAFVHPTAQIVTDEAAHWGILNAYFDKPIHTINHSESYWKDGVHTNIVESFNSRLRRAERGVYHRMAGPHLQEYADELAWREDRRRVSTGGQFSLILRAATQQPVSRKCAGYMQRPAGSISPRG